MFNEILKSSSLLLLNHNPPEANIYNYFWFPVLYLFSYFKILYSMYNFKLFSIWGIIYWFLATMDRYNSWLNHYLEFLSYEHFILFISRDKVLYSCIYFLHNVVFSTTTSFCCFLLKNLLLFFPHTFQHGHMCWIIRLFHFVSLWCTSWSPPFFYTNLDFWVQTEFIFMLPYSPSEQNFFLSRACYTYHTN